jgi:NhaA family Na+:H+ antiporter
MKVKNLAIYLIGGVFMWYFMLNSEIHATVTGVLLAFVIPFGDGSKIYIINYKVFTQTRRFSYPTFICFANTAIVIGSDIVETLTQHYSIGIAMGLVLGKPIGIALLVF